MSPEHISLRLSYRLGSGDSGANKDLRPVVTAWSAAPVTAVTVVTAPQGIGELTERGDRDAPRRKLEETA